MCTCPDSAGRLARLWYERQSSKYPWVRGSFRDSAMNYRHHFHAGNFADVVKHVVFVQLFRALQAKPKGFVYLDTHAGLGVYDLSVASSRDSKERRPQWPEGV